MSSLPLELSDIFSSLPKSYVDFLSVDKSRVHRAIVRCRTRELGAHVSRCDRCNFSEQSYNSCRNRHCPKCQGGCSAKWTSARSRELLEVPYFHTVFTIPKELKEIAYMHKRVFYELMFKAVSETMKAVARNPMFLGAEISFYAVLHTWNQRLEFHPHIHVVSPNGGFSENKREWKKGGKNFFLPVRALSKVYRGKLVELLRRAFFLGRLSRVCSEIELEKVIGRCHVSDWVVYSKHPFGGPRQVIKYLSSYVHRVAISNRRLRSFDGERVTFAYRCPERKDKKRLLTLSKTTFANRFLLHILPKNFTRIRHYGFLASRTKARNLELARRLISEASDKVQIAATEIRTLSHKCKECDDGIMHCVYWCLPMIPHRSTLKNPTREQSSSPP